MFSCKLWKSHLGTRNAHKKFERVSNYGLHKTHEKHR